MARCWSCGSEIPGGLDYYFTCPHCEQVQEIKRLREEASANTDRLAKVQQHGFEMLSEGLSEIATVMEWGFSEINWQLEQQTDILRGIHHTLKTPSETQAEEWRVMAEELRRRKVFQKSEELFLKANNLNPLDYRIYVGLAETYLQLNEFNKAKTLLEDSIPHAPDSYYTSYSYRLIARIHFCEENYPEAASIAQIAVGRSPSYEDAHYDYAQYSALSGKKKECLVSLQKLISAQPRYFYLAQKERNFDPLRGEVEGLLKEHNVQVIQKTRESISDAEMALREAEEQTAAAVEVMRKCKVEGKVTSANLVDMESRLKEARNKVASADLIQSLEAENIARELGSRARDIERTARAEREKYQPILEKKLRDLKRGLIWSALIGFVGGIIIGGVVGAIIFSIVRWAIKADESVALAIVFYLLLLCSAIGGAVLAVRSDLIELQRLRKGD